MERETDLKTGQSSSVIEFRLDGHDKRLNNFDKKIDVVINKFDSLDRSVRDVVDAVNRGLDQHAILIEKQDQEIQRVLEETKKNVEDAKRDTENQMALLEVKLSSEMKAMCTNVQNLSNTVKENIENTNKRTEQLETDIRNIRNKMYLVTGGLTVLIFLIQKFDLLTLFTK